MIARKISNIYRLGVKELWSLIRDPILLILIAFTFTVSVYTAATAMPDGLKNATIVFVDEDRSTLSNRIKTAFYPPQFITPYNISLSEMDRGLDKGDYTFVVNIPPYFQRDVLAGKQPSIQLNIDATRMSQAFTGNMLVNQIINGEVTEYLDRVRQPAEYPVMIEERMRFNPNLTASWFGALIEIINLITLLAIILTGAALIREREKGTVEHLLVMPLTPFEIMLSKIWSMGVVVLVSATLSLIFIVQGVLNVPIIGSIPLFLLGSVLHLFAMSSIGIYLATVARNMPQFGMLMLLVLVPLQMLSGGMTPRESMPEAIQDIMVIAPTTHFIELGKAILFKDASMAIVWPQFLMLLLIGSVFFYFAHQRFRATISRMA
ncbi:ABC transporter permease [Wohlfahrtiimonas chitiniclastica]|uniref:ABC transporter permease n=1 Tax=Wohlfahrtiimonas chitiniclastica TaxID=400946 RepID=UPI0007B3FE27|nr:ABC transporter permease [Wohlfahrtiimonas chitiniclastica]KZS23500.1 inner membrane transport permease yhhJ [Wohlfahrtiimonas chitiniclastica]WHR55901.1 ABC transporter permease [Wohlfahrtiimonas chitiniclastica]